MCSMYTLQVMSVLKITCCHTEHGGSLQLYTRTKDYILVEFDMGLNFVEAPLKILTILVAI